MGILFMGVISAVLAVRVSNIKIRIFYLGWGVTGPIRAPPVLPEKLR